MTGTKLAASVSGSLLLLAVLSAAPLGGCGRAPGGSESPTGDASVPGPGLYLPRYTASQMVVAPPSYDQAFPSLPLLWVPAEPGQPPPDVGALVVRFDDGTEETWYSRDASFEDYPDGLSPGALRGEVTLVRGSEPPTVERSEDGTVTGFMCPLDTSPLLAGQDDLQAEPILARRVERLSVFDSVGALLAQTEDVDLTVVQVGRRLSGFTMATFSTCSSGQGSIGEPLYVFSLVNGSEGGVTLVSFTLPASSGPVTVTDAEGRERDLPVEMVPVDFSTEDSSSSEIWDSATTLSAAPRTARQSGQWLCTPLVVFEVDGATIYHSLGIIAVDLGDWPEDLFDLDSSVRP